MDGLPPRPPGQPRPSPRSTLHPLRRTLSAPSTPTRQPPPTRSSSRTASFRGDGAQRQFDCRASVCAVVPVACAYGSSRRVIVVTCRLSPWFTRMPKIPSVARPSRGPVQSSSPFTEKRSSSPVASSARTFLAVPASSGLVANETIAGWAVQPLELSRFGAGTGLHEELPAFAQQEVCVALVGTLQIRTADEKSERLAPSLRVEEEGLRLDSEVAGGDGIRVPRDHRRTRWMSRKAPWGRSKSGRRFRAGQGLPPTHGCGMRFSLRPTT